MRASTDCQKRRLNPTHPLQRCNCSALPPGVSTYNRLCLQLSTLPVPHNMFAAEEATCLWEPSTAGEVFQVAEGISARGKFQRYQNYNLILQTFAMKEEQAFVVYVHKIQDRCPLCSCCALRGGGPRPAFEGSSALCSVASVCVHGQRCPVRRLAAKWRAPSPLPIPDLAARGALTRTCPLS